MDLRDNGKKLHSLYCLTWGVFAYDFLALWTMMNCDFLGVQAVWKAIIEQESNLKSISCFKTHIAGHAFFTVRADDIHRI